MPFIGNQPVLSYTSFVKQDFTTSATTSYTLSQPVSNANEIALFINFVRQEPTTAYTASGTTLTLTSATSASDDMYCIFLGKALQTVNPPAGSVGASQITDGSITPAKLNLNDNLLFNTANKGIYLGVTSATASNFLDDYEEGLHTVTAYDAGGGATITMNTSFDQLAYTKIGRVVHLQGTLLFASITGTWSGAFQISLPFAAASLTDQAGRGILGVGTYNVDFTTGTAPYFNISEGSSLANMFVSGDNISGGEGRPQSSAQLYVGGSYITDA